jgi:aryl-alcohol dehydrogenase-like predicted oxidoreductase
VRYLEIDTSTRISKIGLGTWQFGSWEWGYGEKYAVQKSSDIVHRALELGITLFDSAEIYGFGRSERILGRALGEDRRSAFLATKFLPVVPLSRVVQQRAAASANRLGVSRIDLYQVHQPSPLALDTVLMHGMRALQRDALVGEVGVSNYSLRRWRAAEDALGSRILSNQVRYSLAFPAPGRDLVPYAESTGRVVIAFSPLAKGLLSGNYHRFRRPSNRVRRISPLFLPQNLDRVEKLITALRGVADAHAATPSQIALAWVIRSPAVAAIPGASSIEQLESNAAAAEIQLTGDECQELEAASAQFRAVTGLGAFPGLVRAQLDH